MSPLPVGTGQCFHLPKHVCACKTDDGIVFLDIRHDRYFGLGGECASAALVNAICNWPGRHVTHSSDASTLSHELREVANALIEKGLLAQGGVGEAPSARALVPRLEMSSPGLTVTTGRPVRLIDATRFLTACSRAAWCLKWRSLESIESGLVAARQRIKTPITDVRDAMELARVFFQLRRWVFSEKNRCLLNALSLVYFLRPYGHYPHFVVGVKTGPFAAHSWVQQGHIVLDGEPASVCHFVPILVA